MAMDPWIVTHSGKQFDFHNPTPDMVCIEDIAHALSMSCRFGGHTQYHYSVAQHSVNVARLVPEEHKLVALLHDATEAYIGDMVSPLKVLMPEFKKKEEAVWAVISEKFNVPFLMPLCIKEADLIMLKIERDHLIVESEPWTCLQGVHISVSSFQAEMITRQWSQRHARDMFLHAFDEFGGKQ